MLCTPAAPASDVFATATADLPEAQPTETVELKNGDTYRLTASFVKKTIGGRELRMLAYNGSIPGPLIKVAQGAEVTIRFTNHTDIPTTLHSHGVRMKNKFDGTPNVTQPAVPPGQSFNYEIKFPDAGVYWYHPHFREDYAQELGLYGNFLVTPTQAGYWSPVNREVVLALDDLLVGPNGIEPFNQKFSNRTLMGRYGNVLLVNGETSYRQEVQTGEVVRFYLTNVANARPLNVGIKGLRLKLVGGDNGRYVREQMVQEVLINPSERAVVEARFATPGTYRLEHRTPGKTYALGEIVVAGEAVSPSYAQQFADLRTDAVLQEELSQLQAEMDGPVDKRLRLGLKMEGMGMMQQQAGGHDMHMMGSGQMMRNDQMGAGQVQKIEWEDDMGMMNVMSNSEMVKWQLIDEDTGKTNMDIDWQFETGDLVTISVFNDPNSEHPMQHPIHFHGNRFLVVNTNGVKSDNLVWKDTATIQTGDRVELLLEVTNPGEWMAHCHIAEHLEAGMMLLFTVGSQ
ncbi:MAG: multicopper oxidase family protein [bacterium]|nr:multicopper oxidase family protein [bacterium]